MSRPPLVLGGRTAVVTGAASGIGRALALAAGERGMHVALCDIAPEPLEETARLVRAAGGKATTAIVDVSDAAAVAAFAETIRAELPPIALLFANAGVQRQGSVIDMSLADWRLLFDVNVLGVVGLLAAFTKPLIAAGNPAQIVITGSTGAMLSPPNLIAYCATKHALWPVAEGLRADLESAGAPVGVTFLMPGAVATRIFDAADPDRPAPADSIEPSVVADMVFDRLDSDPPFILTHPAFVERFETRFAGVIDKLR
ncbi:MAG: SDR family NAD(P)-dependent oxidoreductase [Sphingomonadaceae bacterium]|nr:SDR family NAD(P)-dependent oxidoreductase [Sphingomonadaceae bacterium]